MERLAARLRLYNPVALRAAGDIGMRINTGRRY